MGSSMDPIVRTEWERLYRDAFPRVYRSVLAVHGDADSALEALHDAFAEGLRRPPERRENLEGWLYRVAVRMARRRHRWSLVRFNSDPIALDEIEQAINRMEATRLLQRLTVRQREIVVAHYYLGLTHAETATTLGIRPGTVSATIAKALGRMRDAEHSREAEQV